METKPVVYKTLTCGTCKSDFKIESKRGRPPKDCPSCRDKKSAPSAKKVVTKEVVTENGETTTISTRTRRTFVDTFALSDSKEPIKVNETALWVGTLYGDDAEKAMKYNAREVQVVSIDPEQDSALVYKLSDSGKTQMLTKLSRLHRYTKERVEVDRDATEEVEEELAA